jgi:hypothetical protein
MIQHPHARRTIALAAAVLACLPAAAVVPQKFTHNTADDFAAGKATAVAVSSLGQVRLARKLTPLAAAQAGQLGAEAATVTAAVSLPGGAVALAVDNRVLSIAPDGKITELAKFDDELVFSLTLTASGQLLAGTGGNAAAVYLIDPTAAKPAQAVLKDDDIQSYWSFATIGQTTYVGTGPTGKILEVTTTPGTAANVIADLTQPNILSLATTATGQLVAGTDEDGLIYRLEPKASSAPFVIYDAEESEVVWLGTDAAGHLLAITSEPDGTTDSSTDATVLELKLPDDVMFSGEQSSKSPSPKSQPTDAPADAEADTKETDKATDSDKSSTTKPDHSPSFGGGIEDAGNGSAVYRIDPEGFVTQLYRTDNVIYVGLVTPDHILLGASADEGGQLIELSPDGKQSAVIATAESADVTALLPSSDGSILVGLSNAAAVARLDKSLAPTGTLVSDVLDAGQIARFGRLSVLAETPAGTTVTVATRTSNVEDPDAQGWSPWSAELPAGQSLAVASPAARFLQYRLTLTAADAGPSVSPSISEIQTVYQLPNRAPRIADLTIEPKEPEDDTQPPTSRIRTINWTGTDENEDTLLYSVHAKPQGASTWLLLKDKLTDATWDWDTSTLPDGQYLLRITASDAPSNIGDAAKTAQEISKITTVDNAPPAITDLKAVRDGSNILITATVTDAASNVSKAEAAINSLEDWHVGQAGDTIFDSRVEAVRISLPAIAGAAVITVRATDESGNQILTHVQLPAAEPNHR